ncbi:MAG: YihY/virulence factor BrkB family protein [Bauldia sp.]
MKGAIAFGKALFKEISGDRVGLVAAGCTFYLLLALFPFLAAFVSLYGLLSDPAAVTEHLNLLAGFLPEAGLEIIRTQLDSLVSASAGALSFAAIGSLLLALWSANGGLKTLFEAMNVAYGRTEERTFIGLNLLTLGFTVGALILIIVMIGIIGVVPAVLRGVGLGSATEALIAIGRWPVLLAILVGGLMLLYRFGPSGERPTWREVLPGAVAAAAAWIVASLAFTWYLANFANYNATYGSLGAVIGLLMWTWISVFILIAGAELNALLEARREERVPAGLKAKLPAEAGPARETGWVLAAAVLALLVAGDRRGGRRSGA